MNTQEFEMYHNDTAVKIKLEQEDEVFFVSIDGKFLGSMEIAINSDVDFTTEDEPLKEYIEGISMYLRDSGEKRLLPVKLMNRYSNNLIDFQFTNDDILELIANEETDLEDFGSVIKDLIYDDVTFESKLTVVVSKESSDETFDFDIN